MNEPQSCLRLLRKTTVPALLVSALLAPVVWFYSLQAEFYRRVNAQESLRYGLEVAKAVTAYKVSTGHLPPSATALATLPERPSQLANWTLDATTGLIRLRVADAPSGADTLELVPAAEPGGPLPVYACRSVDVPDEFSPGECKRAEKR